MDEIGMKERTREPGRPSVLPLRLSVVSPQSIIDSGFRRTVEPLSTPFPTFSFPSSPRVWNFNKISEIPILFHARDPPLGETLEGRTIKETRSLLLSPRDPFSLILGPFRFLSSPRGTRYSRGHIVETDVSRKGRRRGGGRQKRGHSNGRAITVSLRGKEKCWSGSLQSPRGGANGSCQTLIFRFTRLDPRSTSTLHSLACFVSG